MEARVVRFQSALVVVVRIEQLSFYLIIFQYPFLFVPILSMNPFSSRDENTLETVLLDMSRFTTKAS